VTENGPERGTKSLCSGLSFHFRNRLHRRLSRVHRVLQIAASVFCSLQSAFCGTRVHGSHAQNRICFSHLPPRLEFLIALCAANATARGGPPIASADGWLWDRTAGILSRRWRDMGGILPPLVESETLSGQPRLGGAALRFQVQRLIDHSTASTAKGASCELSAPPHFRRSPAQSGAPLATQGSIMRPRQFSVAFPSRSCRSHLYGFSRRR